MSQHAVLRYCYDVVFKAVKKLGEESRLFSTEKGNLGKKGPVPASTVYLSVSDIGQLIHDKNNQKVFIDDTSYDAPTSVGIVLAFTTVAKTYSDVLEIMGCIIRYFKDNNSFALGDYAWHEDTSGFFYLEPLVRDVTAKNGVNLQEPPVLTLEYKIELAINSENGVQFKRVEQRDIKSKNIGNTDKA
jgi:hypothetical protein